MQRIIQERLLLLGTIMESEINIRKPIKIHIMIKTRTSVDFLRMHMKAGVIWSFKEGIT